MKTSKLLSMTDGEIIDMIGSLKVQQDQLGEQRDELAEELLSRGFVSGDGAYFHGARIEEHYQWPLDRAKLERDHGEAFAMRYSKRRKISEHVKVTALARAAAAAMAAE